MTTTVLQCCLNGSRDAEEHPGVPVTAESCAADAAAVVAAGAQDLHVHPRTGDGRDSLEPADVAHWVKPGSALDEGAKLPDHASVNWHERDAVDLAAALVDRGVQLSAGLWTEDAARDWLASSWREHTSVVLLELADAPDQRETAEALLELVRPTGIPVLLHGEGRSAWPMLDLAVELGVSTRIGLEDVVEGPDGEHVDGNLALVELASARGARRE